MPDNININIQIASGHFIVISGHFIVIKWSTYQEDKTIIHVYITSISVSKYTK